MDKNSNLNDRFVQCIENGYITYSDFLDEREQSQAIKTFSKNKDCNLIIYGKNDNFERGIAVFVPSFFELEDTEDLKTYFDENGGDPICRIFVKKDRFSQLSHRDYLGALMGLGIERKTIGDIVVTENGAYVFVGEKMKTYILQNLKTVGRGSVEVSENTEESFENIARTKLITTTLPSMRLDNIVSSAFSLSRSKAVQAIVGSTVFLNGVQTEKPDAKVVQGDKIVLRKKGKAVIKNILGKSKKDRFIVEIELFM